MRTKIREFKAPAWAMGKIMGAKGLGKTGESWLKLWLKGEILQRKPVIKSKFLDKGNLMEDNGLDLAGKYFGVGMLLKNERRFEDDYFVGYPDAIIDKLDLVPDVKCSWSWESFPLVDTELPSKDYYWQLQTYMALTGKNKAAIVYCLLDTPRHLIEREAFYYARDNGYEEADEQMIKDFTAKMTYGDVPGKDKIKVFEIKRNDIDIEQMKIRVEECREYLKTLRQ